MSFIPAVAFTGLSLAGAGLSAFGQYKAGQEEKAAYEHNALISDQEAQNARTAERLLVFKRKKEIAYKIGDEVSAYAAAGVAVGTGSPIDVLTDNLSNAYLDLAIDRYNLQIQARRAESEAALQRFEGAQAAKAGLFGAGMTLLSAGGEALFKTFPRGKPSVGGFKGGGGQFGGKGASGKF